MEITLRTRARLLAVAALSAAALLPWSASAQRMTFLHTPPASGQAGKNLEIVGNIFGAGDLSRARCRYRPRGGAWKQVDLALEYGDLYRAIIPGSDVVPPGIEYYCVAFDYFGGQMELYGSASSPRRVHVTGEARPNADEGDEPSKPEKPDKVDKTDKTDKTDRTDKTDKTDKGPAKKPDKTDKADKVDKPARPTSNPEPDEPTPAKARAKDEELALFGAEDVVSLATRQAQSVSDAPAIATGVSDEQMRALGLRSLPEALKLVPGLETSRDVQGFWRVAVRGIRDDASLLVLYDGHVLNCPYDGKALLDISTENVERVEVMRGPGSALYGTGAFLGAVNVVPKRREDLEGAVSAGSFGTVDGHLSAGHRFGDFQLYADADVLHTDGYRATIDSDAASATMVAKTGRAADVPAGITNDSRLSANAGVEVRYAPAGGAMTRLSARYLHEDRGALVGLFDTVGHDSKLQWDVFLADLTEEVPFSSGAFNAHLYFDEQIVDRTFQIEPDGYPLTDQVIAANGLFERTRFTARNLGLDASLDLALVQWLKLSLGITGVWQTLPSYDYELNFQGSTLYPDFEPVTGSDGKPLSYLQAQPEVNSRLIGGVFAQFVARPFDSLSITLGLRLDITQLPRVTVDDNGDFVSINGTEVVPSLDPRVGLVWTPAPGWSLKLLYGRAFRAPTVEELSEQIPINNFNQGRFEGNPGLQPALVDTVEAGVEVATAVGENKVRLRVNGFFNNFTNPIMPVDTTGNVIPLKNRTLGVRAWGAEGDIRFEVSSRAWTFVNVSWFHAEDLAAADNFQYLTDVPQYRVNWGAQIPLWKWFDFSVLAQAGAERRNNDRSQLEILRHWDIPGYILFGAQLRTELIADHVEFALTAQNVFNYGLKDDVPRPDADRLPGLLPREGFGAYFTIRGRL